jgi:hypothetical protein
MDWIVKIHPANLAKNRRDQFTGEQSELVAIRKALGSLPGHIKLIDADSDISTVSLFDLMDVCLTVRGTVGIEAACANVRVITAGTGRYDHLGFTIDPETPDEYRAVLGRAHELGRPNACEVEAARRFAYGVFAARPLTLESITFGYGTDPAAPLRAALLRRQAADPFEASDVSSVARWIRSGDDDYLDERAL